MNSIRNDDTGDTVIPRNGRLSHAYIVWGGIEAERVDLAGMLAAVHVCDGSGRKPCRMCTHCNKAFRHIHPDIITVARAPDARDIIVDQIRALREDAFIMPNEAAKKVYILSHADSMNSAAQNAILKLLEEPPESAAFILIADNPAALLPTVRSRCVELSADRHEAAAPGPIRDDTAAFYQALADSPLKLAELMFPMEKADKRDFFEFIASAKALLVLKLKERLSGGAVPLTPETLMKAVGVLDRAEEYLDLNVSLGHITGMICAELIKADGGDRT